MTNNQVLIGVALVLGTYILLTLFQKEEAKSNACGCGA
jgi:hypothetical protein